mmetsp:Transcript_73574/g.157723  ORF Transcript_73574/g.157723 Transcript_73574/m.157723 type:complete len:207 (+) Transcript_73574:674-1294(+)
MAGATKHVVVLATGAVCAMGSVAAWISVFAVCACEGWVLRATAICFVTSSRAMASAASTRSCMACNRNTIPPRSCCNSARNCRTVSSAAQARPNGSSGAPSVSVASPWCLCNLATSRRRLLISTCAETRLCRSSFASIWAVTNLASTSAESGPLWGLTAAVSAVKYPVDGFCASGAGLLGPCDCSDCGAASSAAASATDANFVLRR